MPRPWAKTLDHDKIEVGDDLPILVKHEDQQSIDLYAKLASTAPRANWNNLHTDEGFAKGGIFGGTVNMGVHGAGDGQRRRGGATLGGVRGHRYEPR